jgi:predicted nuclease with RNAse H fold
VIVHVLGVDCAVRPENTGIALAEVGSELTILDVRVGGRGDDPASIAAEMLSGSDRAVVAIDAPLGWPSGLGTALASHRAGFPMLEASNSLFRRLTDDVVAQRTGKRPLDVGADRIARTAISALGFLDGLREATGWVLPVATQRDVGESPVVLEVYPAATLHVRGVRSSGYKGPQARPEREQILDALGLNLDARVRNAALASDHVLDAILCCLATADYLTGPVFEPEDLDRARHEGWIWVRSPV